MRTARSTRIRFGRRLAVIASLFISVAEAHEDGAHATYLGNEGVLVERGDTKILFDAFYAQSFGQYAMVPNDILSPLMRGAPPYDGVDAIFVSHVHGDHFSAGPTIAYMREHTDVVLYAPTQVYDALLDGGINEKHPLLKRVVAVDIQSTDAPEQFTLSGIEIDVVRIPHAGGAPRAHIQNYAWRVTLDGETTVIHLGDADPNPEHFLRHKAHFDAKHTDAAFPPYWFIDHEDGAAILKNIIAADQTIGVHVPARAIGNGDAWREDAGGDLFTDPGETRDLDLVSEDVSAETETTE